MTMIYKSLLTACALLASLPAFATEEWTPEQISEGMKVSDFTRSVPAGKQRVLDSMSVLNPDCTIADDFEATITKEAEHGNASIETVERYPSFKSDNVRAKCNGKKMQMSMLVYKAAVSFNGTDKFEVTTLLSNGMTHVYRYTVKIVDVDAKKKTRTDLR
jgi:hypothetical protein